jgi:hypothetical protein
LSNLAAIVYNIVVSLDSNPSSDVGELDDIDVSLPPGGFNPSAATEAVRASGLPDQLRKLASGPFGQTSTNLAVLEGLAEAVDLALCAGETLRGQMLEGASDGTSLSLPDLSAPQRQLVAAFETVITCDAARRTIGDLCGLPDHEGSLDLDGLPELLRRDQPEPERLERILRIANGWLEHNSRSGRLDGLDHDIDAESVAHAVAAFFGLLRAATLDYVDHSKLQPLVAALEERHILVAGHPYDGLRIRERTDDRTGLQPVTPDEIVGNDEYLEAGLGLARDVAGYDFEAGRNPKQLNPILFGLGPPGSGKTITAHAVGNYFLDFCRQRDVPARFRVVRRTDWASSYQNASARNLVDIFRDEIYEFDGVSGVYWPDIDTAFASRSSNGLRMEEKQNLGAVFGIFDGTLLPQDGKWFLICDANTLHMDDATVSRIAQNPMRVEGPTDPDHYVELMRDIQLDTLETFVPDGDETWEQIGRRAADLGLTGRDVEAICRQIRTHIQDFEYPDRYFEADSEQRREIVRELSNPVDAETILAEIDEWQEFHRDTEREAERERFEQEVDSLVERLNASGAETTSPEP